MAWTRTEDALQVEVQIPFGADGILQHASGQTGALPAGLHRRSWPIETNGA
ncbi:hypothetical protein [Glycomyces niveus]|uniref:hypothetical protein n=1 Tax=Glycomyces niveus TaxID=2820287 RepID=UPI0027DB101A|nr:hypothetical protein [Glycomyces sp. NEAU-S30]